MTKQEKLKKLQELKNPLLKSHDSIQESVTEFISKIPMVQGKQGEQGIQGIKGDDGYTPVKGQDYYTESEVNFVISYIQSKVTNGIDGSNGIDGKNGYTPVRGVDYWTAKDQEKILQSVISKIPKPIDGISPRTEDIVNNVVLELKKNPPHLQDIKGTKELIEFLKLGGFRGGGGSGGGTTSPLTTKGDLYTFTTVNARLPVGTNGQILSSDSSTSTGLKWIAASTGTIGGTIAATQIAFGSGANTITGSADLIFDGTHLQTNIITPLMSGNLAIDHQGNNIKIGDTEFNSDGFIMTINNDRVSVTGGGAPANFNILAESGWVGFNTASPRGWWDVNGSYSVQTPSNPVATIQYDAGNYFNDGYTYEYHIYSYYDSPLGRVYSSTYATAGPVTDNGNSDFAEQVNISWDAATGTVDGYRILIQNGFLGYSFDYYYDTTDTFFTDGDGTEAGFINGSTVTPSSLGPSIYVDVNGDLLSNHSAQFDGTGRFATKNYLTSTKATFPAGSIIAGAGSAGPGIGFTDYPLDGFASRGDNLGIWQAGTLALNVTDSLKQYRVPSNYAIGFSSATDNNSSMDTSIRRGGANIIWIGGSASGTLNAQHIGLFGVDGSLAQLQLAAGTTGAGFLPIKFASGPLATSPVIGGTEFLTDKLYFTITTGTARKEITLNDIALTSGRVALITTNGRLTDDSDLTFATDTLTATKFVSTQITNSGMTSGRVKLSGTGGLETDDADLTFATDTLTTTGLIVGTTKLTSFNGIATQGLGAEIVYKVGRATAQTAANTSVVTYTAPASDGSYIVSANVLVTTSTVHSFTVTVDYTDEGNTARTLTMQFSTLAGAFITAIANAAGAVPYEGVPLHFRVKASTAITVKTAGTFTTVTYNVEGIIRQLA